MSFDAGLGLPAVEPRVLALVGTHCQIFHGPTPDSGIVWPAAGSAESRWLRLSDECAVLAPGGVVAARLGCLVAGQEAVQGPLAEEVEIGEEAVEAPAAAVVAGPDCPCKRGGGELGPPLPHLFQVSRP